MLTYDNTCYYFYIYSLLAKRTNFDYETFRLFNIQLRKIQEAHVVPNPNKMFRYPDDDDIPF